MEFKFSLATIFAILFRSVASNITLCDMKTKLEMPTPKTYAGECLVECMMSSTNMLDKNGLVNVNRFMVALAEYSKISDNVLKKLKYIAFQCKDQKNSSGDRCKTSALFVKCASYAASKMGYQASDVLKTIISVYLQKAVEKECKMFQEIGELWYPQIRPYNFGIGK